MSESPDPDLRDVFKLLYEDDEDDTWAAFSDDEQPTSEDLIPQTELERVEEDVIPQQTQERYTRKRFLAELDSLLDRTDSPSSSKRPRIYNVPNLTKTSIFNSATPPPSLPPLDVYAPFSPLALLARLRTYSPSTFPTLPSPLDPLSLALSGWINSGKQTLRCVQCRKSWSVKGVTEIRDERIRTEVIKRLGVAQKETHEVGCPWRLTPSPGDLVRTLRGVLHPLISSSLGSLGERLQEECLTYGEFRWTSPLNESQLASLTSHLAPYSRSSELSSINSQPSSSMTASALAFFGWYPYHPDLRTSSSIDLSAKPRRTDLVSCRICSRRVGLWSFRSDKIISDDTTEKKGFDLRGEHLEWCPLKSDNWWEGSELLREVEARKERGAEAWKGWLVVSDKLEKKPWRR